jgi:hypothetical protein
LIPATQFRGAGFCIDAKVSHISGFVQVGKATPIGFRLVVGLREQDNAHTDINTLAALQEPWLKTKSPLRDRPYLEMQAVKD